MILPITNVDVIGDVIGDVMWSRNRLYILLPQALLVGFSENFRGQSDRSHVIRIHRPPRPGRTYETQDEDDRSVRKTGQLYAHLYGYGNTGSNLPSNGRTNSLILTAFTTRPRSPRPVLLFGLRRIFAVFVTHWIGTNYGTILRGIAAYRTSGHFHNTVFCVVFWASNVCAHEDRARRIQMVRFAELDWNTITTIRIQPYRNIRIQLNINIYLQAVNGKK